MENLLSGEKQSKSKEIMRKLAESRFVKDNQTVFMDINTAVDKGDFELAHRLSHTLKGYAALIDRPMLQEAAFTIESSLRNGKPEFTNGQMNTLKLELDKVIAELEKKNNT